MRLMQLLTLRLEGLELLGDVLHSVIFITDTLGHDAVIKRDVRASSAQLPHLERVRALLIYVESLAVAVRRQEDVIVDRCVDRLGEGGIERDRRCAVFERPRSKIFKPVLR